MERWVLLRKGADFEEIGRKYNISPRLAALIRNRDVIGDEAVCSYLNGMITDLHDGMLMKDMDRAVDILLEKIKNNKRIRIIGDYDIDGVNSVYILLEALEALGAYVDSDIPDRMKEGYGLNEKLIRRAYDSGIDTIITCDNGIAAAEEIAYGKKLGMTIIVTDHHEVPFEEREEGKLYQLPPADAVVDPKREDCPYPFKGLCGAAVAYKLVEVLFQASGRDVDDMDYLIENVAIATVGDVMDLVDENRVFVKEGLAMLKRTSNQGLKALIQCTGIQKNRLKAYHIGFILGPCLNAGGRLSTAKRALKLLRADTKEEADILAGDLKALNDSRKELTVRAVQEAICLVEETSLRNDRVLVIYLPDCHESLAGIVAGKIKERYYKPVFVLTDSGEDVKGSGRSIDTYSMYEELNKCRQLLSKYGGHRLAAGLTLKREHVDTFRRQLNKKCTLSEDDLTEKVVIDMELPFSCVTEKFIEELELLEPYGKGNIKPVFAGRDIEFTNARIIGKGGNVLKALARDKSGVCLDALYFGDVGGFRAALKEKGGRMSVTFYPGINEYMGNRNVQITVTHYK
ncbi:MAG: single-stranded-DNA-specific exonuclease RecJ [Dorea sp.]|nr:single-stranded-DNA-specific exonuclease RecJ [Dorea sp.]